MSSKFILNISDTQAIITISDDQLGGSDALEFTEILTSLNSQHIKSVICDLAKVELMNSSGLGMLVGGHSSLKKQDIDFSLCCVPEKIMDLLSMTHLDKVFKIYPDVETAKSS